MLKKTIQVFDPKSTTVVNTTKVIKTNEEWKKELDEETYRITREKGTESPWTGKYTDFEGKGWFYCSSCKLYLFDANTKYHSGCGWPSFYDVISNKNVYTKEDNSIKGRPRVEVLCKQCDAHLGHVFKDGPKQTGLRYCINSKCIDFEEKEEQEEEEIEKEEKN
ncbi:methionine sulfoxide reductase [Anaeramoeba flamelloides]|uniref:Peptide-methionine (R)-S-oxide reductase n=1 Tax=Anaeramoeba flamelloides TaxID=1746091 RepID=A0AAV8A538_9EUKA|nr:methionine sulfoxide reductase [Anaeramoeba flamelloides]KAJ6228638.1 methionine sulfoxide reductase [Anaeramoeba flamelloides]|eukprot:Anaeramoba_flamelloidesa566861_245.p1 GENE.a566861_245~~a566861_245.p1  ORF type:complete len:164 (-),score=47.37 a566861_245:271-762(-)